MLTSIKQVKSAKTTQSRQELASFLGKSGRGINCRIDIQILNLEDIKRASFELGNLAKNLVKIQEQLDMNEVLQVLTARHEFVKTKAQIKAFTKKVDDDGTL